MSKSVEFYYDYGSPASYLAWTQMPALCKRHGADLIYHPILVGGLFKTIGSATPAEIPAKRVWFFDDMERHAARYGVRFQQNPHFILNTLPLMRGAIWAEREGCLEAYNQAMFEACWADARNMNDPAEIMATLKEGGFDAEMVASTIQEPEVKQALIQATQTAVDRGAFGVPTIFVADQMHFGQDRLDFVEQALAA
ncbi:MAG: 2-hydroxychromene-2-carboxylate isomerase [Geminicoccaceae bacterium]